VNDGPATSPRIAVVDVGNSRLSLAVCSPRHLPPARSTVARPESGLPDPESSFSRDLIPAGAGGAAGLVEAVAGALSVLGADRSVLVSVVPAWTELLRKRLPELEILDHTWPMPFTWGVEHPGQVGPDRLANVALARAWGLADALVVDAGTATTFDLLADGEFRGGLIAPGMAFAGRKLGESAARLEVVPFVPCPPEVGRDTASAMAAGAWLTGTQGILGTIASLLDTYGRRPVVITGGLGGFLAGDSRILDPFWTLRGVAWLAIHRSGDLPV